MTIDWTKLYKQYRGLWLALAEDELTVLASGTTAKEAWTNAKKKGHKKPILTHMPEKLVSYIGFGVHEV